MLTQQEEQKFKIILLYAVAYKHIKDVQQYWTVLAKFWQVHRWHKPLSENVYNSEIVLFNPLPLEGNGGACLLE